MFGLIGPLQPELQLISQGDLGDGRLDEHLNRQHVEPLERGFNHRKFARRGENQQGVVVGIGYDLQGGGFERAAPLGETGCTGSSAHSQAGACGLIRRRTCRPESAGARARRRLTVRAERRQPRASRRTTGIEARAGVVVGSGVVV